jgi:sigma-B regulation protein RsbU (phosphoserine phosphatase)
MPEKNMDPIPFDQIPLFSKLNTEEIAELGGTFRLKRLGDNQVLFNEGDPGSSFYIIISGKVDVIKAMGSSEERLLNTNGPGDFIGEMSLLSEENTRTATVLGHGDAHLLELSRSRFEEMLEKRPSIGYHMVRELSSRLRANDEAVIEDLRKKNQELAKAYDELKAAQKELIQKEKLEAELEMARKIQFSILPQNLKISEDCKIGAKMVPARAVGGDFYDVLSLPEGKVGLAIGDVSDKGAAAAMFMAQFCTLLRSEAKRHESPVKVLTEVNNALIESNRAGMFVTVIYGIYDPQSRTFHYARAGHEVPVIFNGQGEISQPEHDQGSALCVFPDPPIDEQTIVLSSEATLMMYTDGGTDAMNTDERFFGLDSLKKTISAELINNPQELCEQVIETLLDFQGDNQFDDATLVALRVN